MAQPISAGAWKRISGTAAGTTILSDAPSSLNGVFWGANYTGTVTFYDSATSAGTSATNQMIAINNNTGTIPSGIYPMVSTRFGLVAISGGTTDILVSVG